MSRNHEKAITAAGDDAEALRALARAAHVRCSNLEKLLLLVLKTVGPVTISQSELAGDPAGSFELSSEGEQCVVTFVSGRPPRN